MEICRRKNQIEISELDPFLAELLRQIPASATTEGAPAAEQRIFSLPINGKETEMCAEWKMYVEPELRRLFQTATQTVGADLEQLNGNEQSLANRILRIPTKHAPIDARRASKKHVVPTIKAPAKLDVLLGNSQREQLERDILPNHIQNSRWFGSKARNFRNLKVTEQVGFSADNDGARLWFIEVNYLDAPTERYAIPVKIASGETAHSITQNASHAIVAHFGRKNGAILCDAIWDEAFRSQLFDAIVQRRTLSAQAGQFVGLTTSGVESQEFDIPANSHGSSQPC